MHDFFEGLTADQLIRLLPEDQIIHSLNVEILVGKLAEWLSMSETVFRDKYLEYFGRAAYYHDIGKICIPSCILNKPGALTAEEYSIIQRHPIYAQELLSFYRETDMSGIPSFLFPLTIQAAAYHHEWWNGKGYPFHLCGQDIPYVARVTSLCDAYDAMVGNRIYRKAFTHEYACEEVRRGAGTQFEPALVEVFLAHEAEVNHLFHDLCIYQKEKAVDGKKAFIRHSK
ncbi:cyclic di-GMP phosphodiesterase response regulator RpfG [Anaerotignum neopropionicum]|uniref:Cyclic di-GMP phosphodiesterase response regulator RpfG n=1 Tax=Anaerotignum neopropionicum TaxID=36847 RepID=A0A136WFI6_9FIRM|nr:HD domain-containing phosphohydrolase [Anaerotignum neopropionicum]KXL53119.1 cyclic di-GMP phosphodiesterase response regulator RpfG [Anaerotignum neopropionicum]